MRAAIVNCLPERWRMLRDVVDDQDDIERMQRVCPRWLHMLMPAEQHVRSETGDRQLKEMQGSLESLNGQARMPASRTQLPRASNGKAFHPSSRSSKQ